MMVKVIFIGGTGTDIGKTYVTCLLLRQLLDKGYKVRAIKPVISGFDEMAIDQSDSGLLLREMGLEPNLHNAVKISPWRFKQPLPPHLVANNMALPIDIEEVARFCQRQAEDDLDFLLIEGVGGIMTPLDYETTTLDLMVRLNCTCLLVTGSYLGTLSHTLTALTCLKQSGVAVSGVIISESERNYINFDEIIPDFTKIIPKYSIKKIGRNSRTVDIFSLII
ncbi:MAG: dethiobiotin synthase [Alphaproteobacteria bacterium]|nr:MAG: dethiobiotin synthase [Alphaproteobacteria bacterium]